MEKITLDDIAKIKCASEIQLSPDGSLVSYVITTPDKNKNSYFHDVHVVNLKTGKHMQFTHDGNSSNYIYDDEQTLLFPAERSNDDKAEPFYEKTVFYRLPLNGGEAYPAFSIDKNVTFIEKVSNGLYAVKALVDWNAPDPTVVSKEECEEEKDYHIFEEVPFWGNGRGYVSGKRNVLFLYNEVSKTLLRITDKYTNVSSVVVQDGKIAYIARKYDEVINLTASLNLYDTKTKKNKVIEKQNKFKISNIAFTKDSLVYTASDMKIWGSGQLEDFYRYDLKTGKLTLVCKNTEEFAIGDVPLSDTFNGGGTTFKAVNDVVYFTAMKKYKTNIYALTKKNTIETVLDSDIAISCFDKNKENLVFIGSKPNGLNAIYQLKDKKVVSLDEPNKEFVKGKFVAKAEYIPFKNSNGDKLDGWVLKPYNYDPKKKYPGILEIHGGPRCAYGTAFFHEMQVFASNGYFVFFTNPRGSEGYGEEFADIRGKYGTIDFEDLMEFTDLVLKKFKQIDEKRIGCAGGSYGGFMCNWIEGNTDRFSAIASQRSVSNWVADFGSSEIGVTFDSNEMAATPWTNMQKMWDQSPLKYACNAKTPILFIHSLCDYNCPIEQGVEMFTAMKYFHVPSRMVTFEGENHSLSRSGKPKHRIRRLKEMNDWFDKYLKG